MLRRVALVRTDVSEQLSASIQSDFVFLRSVRWLQVTAIVVPSSPILVTLMMWSRKRRHRVKYENIARRGVLAAL
jgi:hypothetical protein